MAGNAERPSVSIIIPCYNYACYLAEAIESALAQTWPADEIIIVDDGSTDDSLEVAQRYAHYPTMRIIAQANAGAVAACNEAVRISKGSYFLRVDADDRLDPQYLEFTMPLLEVDDRAGYVYTGYRYFGSRSDQVGALPFDGRLLTRRPYILGTCLIRRRAFDQVGGYSLAMADAYEDWDFYLTLVERGWHGVPVTRPLYYYRQHGHSRNRMSFRRWIGLIARLHRRHRPLYSAPLAVFLFQSIADRCWQRARAAIHYKPRRSAAELR